MTLSDMDRRQLDGATVIASLSGGKDSTAMALWLREVGVDARYVFADTGWEAAETYDYIDSVLRPLLGEIAVVQGRDGGLADLVRRKEVVEWARTDRGGRQMLLMPPEPADEGCMRWGLCEHDTEGDA